MRGSRLPKALFKGRTNLENYLPGPRIRWRLFTNLSLLRTRLRILMMSAAMVSSNIFTACGAGTERARSLIRSRALSTAAGSNVFLVVLTDMEPSTKSSVHAMPYFSKARVCSWSVSPLESRNAERRLTTSGHTSLKYASRYLGKRQAKVDLPMKLVHGQAYLNSGKKRPTPRQNGRRHYARV